MKPASRPVHPAKDYQEFTRSFMFALLPQGRGNKANE
jgi:hypothetical protein